MEDVASDTSVVSEPAVEMMPEDEEGEEEIEELEEILEEEIEEMEEEVDEGADEGDSAAGASKALASTDAVPRSPAKSGTKAVSTTTSTTGMLEGSNIHYSADGKKLCSHSSKCEYLCKKKGNRRCTNPVPPPHEDVVYCSHHRQILGLQPRTVIKRGKAGKPRADLRTKGAHTALMNVLAKHGIPEKSAKRKGAGPAAKRPKPEPETQPTAAATAEDESSDEFPSDDEENADEADVESGSEDAISDQDRDFDNDAFLPDSFLWHLEHDDLATDNDPLQDQKLLSEEEVLQRRKAKVVKLLQLYKLQYYRLQDNLQSTFELYNKKFTLEKEKQSREGRRQAGKVADKRAKPNRKDLEQEEQLRALYIHAKESKVKLEGSLGYCSVPECRMRALVPSTFCLTHILQDPKQQLYIGCTYGKGDQKCGFPILRTTQPPLCDAHMDARAERESATSNKKKRKASQLLEEREREKEKEKAAHREKKGRRRTASGSGKKREPEFMKITSENASQFPLALVLARVDYNVGVIQEKRGILLEEENKRLLEQQQA